MDSGEEAAGPAAAACRRHRLSIDLNEIPSPSGDAQSSTPTSRDAYEVALRFHVNPPLPELPAAAFPGEAGEGNGSVCGVCGRREVKGDTVVCDRCEKGFHLECVKIKSRQSLSIEKDWVCGECKKIKQDSKRWPLGVISGRNQRGGGARLLDMNELPPIDGDGDAVLACSPNGSSPFEDDSRRLNFAEDSCNGINGELSHYPESDGKMRSSTEEKICGNGVHSSSHRKISSSNKITVRQSTRHKSEVFLQSLKEFIAERRGFLEEGWNVEFKQRPKGQEMYPIFCSPDGEHFDSMTDVANHLGLISDEEKITTSDSPRLKRMKNAARLPKISRVSSDDDDGTSDSQSHQLNSGLPLQFGDLLITSLGKVDRRRAYHDAHHIWPVGYACQWHDKVTGSVFICKVTDGGDSGPIFRIKRYPCSMGDSKIGKIVLLPSGLPPLEDHESYDDFDDEDWHHICLLASDPDPSQQAFMSCVLNPSSSLSADIREDEIGEFHVRGKSSSAVWRMASKRIINLCRKVFANSGSLLLGCSHRLDSQNNAANEWALKNLGSLSRFCSDLSQIVIPNPITTENELEASCESLAAWLEQDRFGLDVDFAQEILELLPGALQCRRYTPLNKRNDYSSSKTIANGMLTAVVQNTEKCQEEKILSVFYERPKISTLEKSDGDLSSVKHIPPGRPLKSKFPLDLMGDVIHIWEFLFRFFGILGLGEPISLNKLEDELIDPWPIGGNQLEKFEKEIQEAKELSSDQRGIASENPTFLQVDRGSVKESSLSKMASQNYDRCTGAFLLRVHVALLKVLVGELLSKVAVFGDPDFDPGESKSRRGRKRDIDTSIHEKIAKIKILPANSFSWPELARRYILAVLFMDRSFESSEISNRDGLKIFRCVQGDGGVLCGSVSGVAGMEAETLLLAEAHKLVFEPVKRENEAEAIEEKESSDVSPDDTSLVFPEWAVPLEPVRKLPTNVGTRIRKCIYESLDKNPPDWARKILEHSISKEIYKGNASGPTKKAVLSVLEAVAGGNLPQKPIKQEKIKPKEPRSDLIMKQCRTVLRKAVAADEDKVFCNLLGFSMSNPNDNDEEGILGFPAMVSRPLDFRTIDLRLAVGAYGGAHEVFVEDVREVWRNIAMAYGDRPDLMELAETLSKSFELLYEKEVLSLLGNLGNEDDTALRTDQQLKSEIPKAPWEEGVCKICGIDKDDDSVLLCDTCDSEYHTYCLNPPLLKIPEGNWYCPSCVQNAGGPSIPPDPDRQEHHMFHEDLTQLVVSMEKKEYWELSIEERTFLLKFLCDEVLNSTLIREQLDQCVDTSNELQQKIRSITQEWNELKLKKDLLTAGKVNELVLDLEKTASEDQLQENTDGAEELKSLDGEFSRLEETFSDLESKLLKSTLRRDFLGRDSLGQMYWSMVKPGQRPWLFVDQSDGGVNLVDHGICSPPFVFYESDQEIQALISSLRESDSRERELKESILQWQKLPGHYFYGDGHVAAPSPLANDWITPRCIPLTRALISLENKYGPLMDSDGLKKRSKMRRCECLEPIWASKPHCLRCHQTFESQSEMDNHAEGGKCSVNHDDHDSMIRSCPFDLKEVTRRFIPKGSIEDLVNDIGLIGSNSIISIVQENPDPAQEMEIELYASSLDNVDSSSSSFICGSSLRPIWGKSSFILTQLKINLLDMEAALPNEALKIFPWRRCAWRSLTKSARSIYQVVQASVLLEGMIKSEYLKSGWWHWSSLTAAARIGTISALALRIYTLDSSIVYAVKSGLESGPIESAKTASKPAKRRKDTD